MESPRQGRMSGVWLRTRWLRRVFLLGLLLGIILGWFLHTLVTNLFTILLVAALLVVAGTLLYVWFKLSGRGKRRDPESSRVVVTRSVIARPEPPREE